MPDELLAVFHGLDVISEYGIVDGPLGWLMFHWVVRGVVRTGAAGYPDHDRARLQSSSEQV